MALHFMQHEKHSYYITQRAKVVYAQSSMVVTISNPRYFSNNNQTEMLQELQT